jgi:hypothetical protein
MKIYVNTELRHGRSGVEARSPDLRLTSHGLDEQEALQSLQRGILAWCHGLQSLGKLEKVLRHKQLKWESNGRSLAIELVKVP